jgi:hypothetical protein
MKQTRACEKNLTTPKWSLKPTPKSKKNKTREAQEGRTPTKIKRLG